MQPGNVQPWWIRYSLVLFQEGRDFDSLACLRRLQSKFEGVGEVRVEQKMYGLFTLSRMIGVCDMLRVAYLDTRTGPFKVSFSACAER